MKRLLFFLSFSVCVLHEWSLAQCSDAGVCIIGRKQSTAKHQLALNYLYGKGTKEDMLMLHSVRLDGEFQVFDRSRLSISFPFSFQSGVLGETNGVGDLTAVWLQTVVDNRTSRVGVQVGGKFATGHVNRNDLPQAYQSSLGTNDFLLGVTYENGPWVAAVGYQLSRGRSDNRVTRLRRGDDVLVRAGYKLPLQDLRITGEILAIKRLQESTVLNSAGRPDDFVSVPGSDQLQINVVGQAIYSVSDGYSLQAQLALPLRNREVNVDGLTRSVSLAFGVAYLF